MKDLIITRRKGLGIQVCTTLDVEAATVELNRIDLAGTTHGWVFDAELDNNPCQCAKHSDRQHMVFVC
jgi:hypothetical protein